MNNAAMTLFQHVPLKQSTLIVNCSYPGDTLANMVDWSRNPDFSNLLARKNFGWEWDGILFSAGGNDIINAALSPAGILRACANPADYQSFIVDYAMAVLENHLAVDLIVRKLGNSHRRCVGALALDRTTGVTAVPLSPIGPRRFSSVNSGTWSGTIEPSNPTSLKVFMTWYMFI